MEVKTLLRLIKGDIAHLEGITNEYNSDSLPSSEEVELALVRSKALLRELELLYKIAVQHEKTPIEPAAITELPAQKIEPASIEQEPSELFCPEKSIVEAEKEEMPGPEAMIISESIQNVDEPVVPEVEATAPVAVEPVVAVRAIPPAIPSVKPPEIVILQPIAEKEEEPVHPTKKTLGETLGEAHQLVNDILSPEKGESGFQMLPISSLWDGIGINDRFLFVRELFGNNSSNFESAIDTIDQFNSIQEAVGYLKMNFKWNKTEASQKFTGLIKRRFTK